MPLTITPEAADFIAAKGLQEPYRRMLDNIPLRIPGVRAIAVTLEWAFDHGDDPRLIFDVTRADPHLACDPAEGAWQRWVIATFPPEEFSHFCLLSNYV